MDWGVEDLCRQHDGAGAGLLLRCPSSSWTSWGTPWPSMAFAPSSSSLSSSPSPRPSLSTVRLVALQQQSSSHPSMGGRVHSSPCITATAVSHDPLLLPLPRRLPGIQGGVRGPSRLSSKSYGSCLRVPHHRIRHSMHRRPPAFHQLALLLRHREEPSLSLSPCPCTPSPRQCRRRQPRRRSTSRALRLTRASPHYSPASCQLPPCPCSQYGSRGCLHAGAWLLSALLVHAGAVSIPQRPTCKRGDYPSHYTPAAAALSPQASVPAPSVVHYGQGRAPARP